MKGYENDDFFRENLNKIPTEIKCENCNRMIAKSSMMLHNNQCSKMKNNQNVTPSVNAGKLSYLLNNKIYPNVENKFNLLNSFNPRGSIPDYNNNINKPIESVPLDRNNSFRILNSEQKQNSNSKKDSEDETNINRFSVSDLSKYKFDDEEINVVDSQLSKNSENTDPFCPLCFKTFPNYATLELHIRNCESAEDSKKWDNFEHNNSHQRNNNLRHHFDYFNEGISYSEDENYNDQHIEDEASLSDGEVNLNDSNLNYEELLRLDENITHPLPKVYLSVLPEENLTAQLFSKLNEENKKCMICFDDLEVSQKFIRLPCLHIFHAGEIVHWFERNKTCPVCRMDVELMLK